MTDKQSAIVNLFNLFPEPIPKPKSFDDLFDCSTVIGIYQYFSGKEINIPEMKDWYSRMKATKTAFEEMNKVLDGIGKTRTCDFPALTRRKSVDDMEKYVSSLIDYGLQSDKKEELKSNISKLTQEEQNVIKGMLEAENKVEKKETKSNSSVSDDLKKIKEAIEKIKKENDELKKGNESLKKDIDEIKNETPDNEENNEEDEVDSNKIIPKIGHLKAEIFSINEENKVKAEKKQHLLDVKQHILTLQKQIEEAKEKSKKLETEISEKENKSVDYSILENKLQELRVHPQRKTVQELVNEIKELKNNINNLNQKKELFQAKLDGQQGIFILKERLEFLNKIKESNVQRLERAKLYLALKQKEMRINAFQNSMRTFI